jgi:hypothetical protein
MTEYQYLDDLSLHDEIFAINEGETESVAEENAVGLIKEAATRDDLVLLTSAVMLAENYRNEKTLHTLRHIVNRELIDVTLDTLLLDELAARLPDTNCKDFLPFLSPARHESVRVFCARILFFDEVFCENNEVKYVYSNEHSLIVRLYLAAYLFRSTSDKDYIGLLGEKRKSKELNAARIANIMLKELGY